MKGKQTKFLSKLFRTVLLPSAMLAVATQAQAADYGYYGYSAYRAQLTKLTIHTLGRAI